MSNHLEPTYLRYIYDGLVKGGIHPENAAELPEGLIGLYEEAFDERQPVHKRQQLLERFAIWALLKKEVTAQFVAEVLNQPEEKIQEFIATYSAWFNSPESGKYQLYHERLKVYLLQKLSEGEVHSLHEKFISRLEQAITEQKADEFEWYGLEFLTQHYAVNAMLNGDGSKLLVFAYNQNHWQRQLKISKGYIWTNSGLHSVMNWASKYNDEEVIECGLQMVDLHHQEQNAAPQILALVAEGDFDSAMKLILSFGTRNYIGEMRRCLLFIITLVEGFVVNPKKDEKKNKFLDEIIEKFKIEFPRGSFAINQFTPSYLIFKLIIKLNEKDVDFSFLTNNITLYDSYWRDFIKLSATEIKILDQLETIGMEEGLYRERKKINLKSLNINDINRTEGINLEAFDNLHHAIISCDKAALSENWKLAFNHLINTLKRGKFFEPNKRNGELYFDNNNLVVSRCISNFEFSEIVSINKYIEIDKYISNKFFDDECSTLATLAEKLFEHSNFFEVSMLLKEINKFGENYWLKSVINNISLDLISKLKWRYSKDMIIFIGDITHYSYEDAIAIIKRYQKLINLDTLDKPRGCFSFKSSNIRTEIQDFNLIIVLLIDDYLNSNSANQKENLLLKIKEISNKVRVDKLEFILDFFIENASIDYVEDIVSVIIERVENESNQNKFKILNQASKVFKVHKKSNNTLKLYMADEFEKIDNQILQHKLKVFYPNFFNENLDDLLIEFYELEDSLIQSFDGRIAWCDVIFKLIKNLIINNDLRWKKLVNHQVTSRPKIQPEHLAYYGHFADLTRLFCERKEYDFVFWMANEVPEGLHIRQTIIKFLLKKREYKIVFQLAEKFFGIEFKKQCRTLIAEYIWNDDLVDFQDIKYFIKLMEMDLYNENLLCISHNRIRELIKLLDYNNVKSIETLLAKYAVDNIILENEKEPNFSHLNFSLDLSWYKKTNN
jgi:hypothetical protein